MVTRTHYSVIYYRGSTGVPVRHEDCPQPHVATLRESYPDGIDNPCQIVCTRVTTAPCDNPFRERRQVERVRVWSRTPAGYATEGA